MLRASLVVIARSPSILKLLEFFKYFDILTTRYKFWGGGQNLERRNVDQPIFRNFKISNIKMTENELFDNFILEFNSSFFRNHLNTENIY